MKITPEKIIETYRSVTPYQLESVMRNYIGQEVIWDLKCFDVTIKNDKKLHVGLMSNDHIYITCEINDNDFPLIKIIPKDTPINLVGTIESINGIYIKIKDAKLHEIRDENGQIYFPQGSRKDLLAFIESKILGAKDIKIYDPYLSDDILTLLESASSKANIQLLGRIDSDFLKKVNAFNIYFGRSIVVKKSESSHARFYIIDDEVFHVDPSLKNGGGNKATMVHLILNEEAKKIKDDFDKWWSCEIIV